MRVEVDGKSKTWYYHNGETLPTDEIIIDGNKYVPKEGETGINTDTHSGLMFNGTQWV